jgi:hypothetical protein
LSLERSTTPLLVSFFARAKSLYIPSPTFNPMKISSLFGPGLLALVLLLGQVLAQGGGQQTAPKCQIAFRLQNVHDNYLTNAHIAIMSAFAKAQIPLTVGLVSNLMNQNDVTLKNYLQGASSNSTLFDFACNGFNFEEFANLTRTQQETILFQCTTAIQNYVPNAVVPDVFIPPYNSYNNDTLLALSTAGYGVLSAFGTCLPSNTQWPYTFNSLASTASSGNAGYGNGIPAGQTLDQIIAQVNTCGYSVVGMDGSAFADAANPVFAVNTAQLTQLDNLLTSVPSLGCQIVLLRNMVPVTLPSNGTVLVNVTVPPATNATQPGQTTVTFLTINTNGCVDPRALLQWLLQGLNNVARTLSLTVISYDGCTIDRNITVDFTNITTTAPGTTSSPNITTNNTDTGGATPLTPLPTVTGTPRVLIVGVRGDTGNNATQQMIALLTGNNRFQGVTAASISVVPVNNTGNTTNNNTDTTVLPTLLPLNNTNNQTAPSTNGNWTIRVLTDRCVNVDSLFTWLIARVTVLTIPLRRRMTVISYNTCPFNRTGTNTTNAPTTNTPTTTVAGANNTSVLVFFVEGDNNGDISRLVVNALNNQNDRFPGVRSAVLVSPTGQQQQASPAALSAPSMLLSAVLLLLATALAML